MTFPIIDLHCDLLFYLAGDEKRSPYDLEARCSLPQLREGNVKLQTLAIFTHTGTYSVQKGISQIRIFEQLPVLFPQDFFHFTHNCDWQLSSIGILPAFENASGFCHEEEPLKEGLKRLENFIKNVGKPLYISLTWNTENRFGGGAMSQRGLKEDGKLLLEELHRMQIAVDLSHASDALAYEIIDYIEGHGLKIPLIASHSNSRKFAKMERNLPDEIAKEIFQRGGLIGFNLFRYFIGEAEEAILKHVSHWLELGGEENIAFGSDFFYEFDFPKPYRYGPHIYFNDYQDASCYGKLLSFIQKELKLTSAFLERLSYKNAISFIDKIAKDK